MKRIVISLLTLSCSFVSAQEGKVGINTDDPKATLHIKESAASASSTSNEGVIIPSLSKTRVAATASALLTEGTIVYVNDITYTGSNAVVSEIDKKGFYYYDGAKWTWVNAGGANIYGTDGTLAGNRVVTQGDKTLTFTGTAASATKFINTTGTSAAPVAALQIKDGGQAKDKVLTSDANGVATWKYTGVQSIQGTMNSSGALPSIAKVYYTNSSITLPPGKWAVQVGTTVEMNQAVADKTGGYWVTLFFADSSTETNPNNYTRDAINSIYFAAKFVPVQTNLDFINGGQVIHNTSGADKTYYIMFYTSRVIGNTSLTTTARYGQDSHVKNLFSGWEKYFYATKLTEE